MYTVAVEAWETLAKGFVIVRFCNSWKDAVNEANYYRFNTEVKHVAIMLNGQTLFSQVFTDGKID